MTQSPLKNGSQLSLGRRGVVEGWSTSSSHSASLHHHFLHHRHSSERWNPCRCEVAGLGDGSTAHGKMGPSIRWDDGEWWRDGPPLHHTLLPCITIFSITVIPANAGIPVGAKLGDLEMAQPPVEKWVPAFAGTTGTSMKSSRLGPEQETMYSRCDAHRYRHPFPYPALRQPRSPRWTRWILLPSGSRR